MKVLFVCSEVAPFSKTGGLADVAEALPAALASRGSEVTVVTPLYSSAERQDLRRLDQRIRLRFPFGEQHGALFEAQMGAGHRVLLIDHPGFFMREGLYQGPAGEYPDNHRRFAFMSIGALSTAQVLGLEPDIIHLNDWQTGLAAVALSRAYRDTALGRARTLFTIHNLAYQGNFPDRAVLDLGMPRGLFTPDRLEFHGRLSFIKGGIAFADALSTVSPRYAQEIQTPEMGYGLDGILRTRRDSLHGILNGVDYAQWAPESDPVLPAHFSPDDLSGKEICKHRVLEAFGLALPAAGMRVPLFAMISRLTGQKGIDLVLQALPWLLEEDLQVVVLGTGEPRFEEGLRQLQQRWPQKVSVRIGFDNSLAHLIEAGSDFFLMPSRYEPCGLNQMYSLRYGTIPIVRATGGLDDTVQDIGAAEATGIKFQPYSAPALASAIHRALELYRHPARLHEVRVRGMRKDFSWSKSAAEYEALYRSLQRSGIPAGR